MAAASESGQPEIPISNLDSNDFEEISEQDEEDEEEYDFEDDDEEEEQEPEHMPPSARTHFDRAKIDAFFRRLSTEHVPVRVHHVIIIGNTKTKRSLIESEVVGPLKSAATVQQLLRAADHANARLKRLGIFDSVGITLDAGPADLPGTANVVVEISEAKNRLVGDFAVFSTPEAGSWSMDSTVKIKNLFGYGDLWDGSMVYGFHAAEISASVSVPKFKTFSTPLAARISVLSQDWLKFSSYRDPAFGLSLGLLSKGKHNLSYDLYWQTLNDPLQTSSEIVKKQLGSSLKYIFKMDRRDSAMRPTRGLAFLSTTQIGGLLPDFRSLSFIRQEFDIRCALPLGFYRAALSLGISAGVLYPWGNGSVNTPSYLPDKFFMVGNSSLVRTFRSPISLLGFRARELDPSQARSHVGENSNEKSTDASGVDISGGNLAVTAFADLSFDLPLRLLKEAGIHGHAYVCTGALTRLTDNAHRMFSFQKFQDSFQSSAGFGIVAPTKLFRMEVNYCYILRQPQHDRGKTGLQFCFSSPL